MYQTMLAVIGTLLASIFEFFSHCYKYIFGMWDVKVDGEAETVDWCRSRLGLDFHGLEDLWESGARAVSNLLDDESDTWRDLQDAAIRKINISPTLSPTELNNPCLQKSGRENFVLFLKRIRKFIEKTDFTAEPCTRVSHDLIARGVGLYAAYTSRRAVFYVYSCYGELDSVKVDMKGQAEVKIEKKKRNGRLMVGYTAYHKGTYYLYVSKNGWMAPGCPFEVSVCDAPPGYTGSFGAGEWDKPEQPEEDLNSLDTAWKEFHQKHEIEKPFEPTVQRRNKMKKKQIIVKEKDQKKWSKVAAAILKAKKMFSPQTIPKIQIVPAAAEEEPEFSVWSSLTEFGPPHQQRRRSFTYISAEGATFPLSLSTEGETRFFDTLDNLNIFKNDSDIWAVQSDEKSLANSILFPDGYFQDDSKSKESTPFATPKKFFNENESQESDNVENKTMYKNREDFFLQTLSERNNKFSLEYEKNMDESVNSPQLPLEDRKINSEDLAINSDSLNVELEMREKENLEITSDKDVINLLKNKNPNNETTNLDSLEFNNLDKCHISPVTSLDVEDKYLNSDSSIEEGKQNSIPSLDRLETGSEDTSVSEKIIEVAVLEKYECTIQRNTSSCRGKRRCRSILSIFDLRRSCKRKDLRRTKSAISRLGGRSGCGGFSCLKNNKNIVVKIGEYSTNKEEIKSSRPVRKWKNYWDNLLEGKDIEFKKGCSLELSGIVAKGKTVFEEMAKVKPKIQSIDIKAEEGRKKRFEKARNLFSSLERSLTPNPYPSERKQKERRVEKVSRSLERDLKGLFNDMNHGIGLPGIPNRLALLASLRSIDPGNLNVGYEPNYPHLPTTPPSAFKSRTSCKDLVPWNQILSAY